MSVAREAGGSIIFAFEVDLLNPQAAAPAFGAGASSIAYKEPLTAHIDCTVRPFIGMVARDGLFEFDAVQA